MKQYSKNYSLEEDDFEGSIECYSVDTKKENLKNWLESEVGDNGQIYAAIQSLAKEILIIKNVYLEEEYRGQGLGQDIINEALGDSFSNAAILVCDTYESQKSGFNLEKFYESVDFKTIETNSQNCPLMVYPEELANNIIEKLNQSITVKKNKP